MKERSSHPIIKWPKGERPRERLLKEGPEALTEAQLLAILLRVGRQGKSAVDVGHDILDSLGELQGLANRSAKELCTIPGIGPAKAAQIKAAIELGKRVIQAPLATKTSMSQSRQVYEYFWPKLRDKKMEMFCVVLLNTKHAMIRDIDVSKGTLTSSQAHPREVFNEAIRESAAAIILVHNHPSGDPTPSHEDREVTSRMHSAGKLLGIPVLDHIIIGDDRYLSFSDEGWL